MQHDSLNTDELQNTSDVLNSVEELAREVAPTRALMVEVKTPNLNLEPGTTESYNRRFTCLPKQLIASYVSR